MNIGLGLFLSLSLYIDSAHCAHQMVLQMPFTLCYMQENIPGESQYYNLLWNSFGFNIYV